MRLIRQDLLVELVKCKDTGLVVCVVDAEFLVYRVRSEGFAKALIEDEMVRDIGQVLKAKAAANGIQTRRQTSIHILTNTNFYDSAEHVADELGIRVFCHRFHS